MAADLQRKLGEGFNLPPDLIPDGNYSDDSDDEIAADQKNAKRYAKLALAYYNDKHHTNYDKIVDHPEGRWGYHSGYDTHHCVFSAVETTGVDCESSSVELKHFVAMLFESHYPASQIVVTSCVIVDDSQSVGCVLCDFTMGERPHDFVAQVKRREMESKLMMARQCKELLSQYAGCLVDGVNWSEKDPELLEEYLLALAYYNEKHGTDYKLVDVLPQCSSVNGHILTHSNFIARQNTLQEDTSNKLFFAEFISGSGKCVVTACRILHGCETTAGCYNCTSKRGKRVVHPTSGFFHGLYN